MRYKIRLSYDGSAFCGWQIQNNAVTVQGALQDALAKAYAAVKQITFEKVHYRTDIGRK
jgi:tRNA pseudouridine(38-40) synthase